MAHDFTKSFPLMLQKKTKMDGFKSDGMKCSIPAINALKELNDKVIALSQKTTRVYYRAH